MNVFTSSQHINIQTCLANYFKIWAWYSVNIEARMKLRLSEHLRHETKLLPSPGFLIKNIPNQHMKLELSKASQPPQKSSLLAKLVRWPPLSYQEFLFVLSQSTYTFCLVYGVLFFKRSEIRWNIKSRLSMLLSRVRVKLSSVPLPWTNPLSYDFITSPILHSNPNQIIKKANFYLRIMTILPWLPCGLIPLFIGNNHK